jgi:hypothetical protein
MLRTKKGQRIMAVTFGLACLLAGATSQARVLVNGISVQCITQNEQGQDEIFLRFASGPTYTQCNMGNFWNGLTRGSTCSYLFSSFPIVHQLWESDGNHWWDGDDRWTSESQPSAGSWSVHSVETNGGQFNQDHNYWYHFTLTSVQ